MQTWRVAEPVMVFILTLGLLSMHVYLFVLPRYPDSSSLNYSTDCDIT